VAASGGGDDSADPGDNEGADSADEGQGRTYIASNSDGTYAGAPWGGADCSIAQRTGPGALALLFGVFALFGRRRR
jgi:hypothetical protein